MVKTMRWGHTKIKLEDQSRSGRRKELQELGKQDDKLNKLVDSSNRMPAERQ